MLISMVKSIMDGRPHNAVGYNACATVRDHAGRLVTSSLVRLAHRGSRLVVMDAAKGPAHSRRTPTGTIKYHEAWWDWALELMSALGEGSYVEFTHQKAA